MDIYEYKIYTKTLDILLNIIETISNNDIIFSFIFDLLCQTWYVFKYRFIIIIYHYTIIG